ncbi:MAG TPA: hypothetical protein VNT42_12955 [Sphingomonas sp.]|nr:hypothetical protein [Sphingomonas sp.]
MEKLRPMAAVAAALVLMALGVLNIVYRDSLMTWQPVPEGVSWKAAFAYLSGAILIVSGIGILVPGQRARGAALGAGWIGLWTLALHLPHLLVARDVGALLGVAEASFCALGLAALTGWFDSPPRAAAHRVLFGLCMLVFGLSHFVYADFTAQMVPAWLPQRLGIAYLTGAIHALTGICLLIGVRVRAAATIEALMMSSFVLLLHIPGVAAAPHDRLQLTMLGMAALLSCSAWLVATWPALRGNLPGRRVFA